MTTPTELEAAVERVTAEVERTELCAAKGSPFDPSPALAQLHNAQARWCADLLTILHALAEANERASLLQTAVHERCAERKALEQISRKICDATTQNHTGQWIITGDAEMMLSDLLTILGETAENCIACAKPLKVGDEYLSDISGGVIHFACCGPEPECFVDLETGEPLGRPATPQIWRRDHG